MLQWFDESTCLYNTVAEGKLCAVCTSIYTGERLNEKDEGIVLTYQGYGYLVEYFAQKKSFLDDSSPNYEGYYSLKSVEQEIFSSRNLEETDSLLKSHNIKYLIITPEMKKGLVWN